jgi:hypothetical protein
MEVGGGWGGGAGRGVESGRNDLERENTASSFLPSAADMGLMQQSTMRPR